MDEQNPISFINHIKDHLTTSEQPRSPENYDLFMMLTQCALVADLTLKSTEAKAISNDLNMKNRLHGNQILIINWNNFN
jgi:hypothetical protein